MKHLKMSLMFKIVAIVFVSFAVVLGNEIRLGIGRYMRNTIETDASATVRTLERFSRSYSEMSSTERLDLTSKNFQNIYQEVVLTDTTKIKCLVDNKQEIVSLARGISDETKIRVVVKDYYDSQDWPVYFDLSSLSEKEIDDLEKKLLIIQGEIIDVEILVKQKEVANEEVQYSYSDIQALYINGVLVLENDDLAETDVEYLRGVLNAYISSNQEMYFPQSELEYKDSNVGPYLSDNETPLVVDYKEAMDGLERQIKYNFSDFKNSGKPFISTNYSEYYLLDTYVYNGKEYSTVMLRILDWNKMKETVEGDKNSNEYMDEVAAGYIFVTQEYDDLAMTSLKTFIMDNVSTYFIALIFIILICIATAYMIILPIHRIQKTAKHLSQREFDYPIDMTRHDEIGELGRSIDTMSRELKKTINNLYQEIERVQKLEILRKDFISNFTHEIKTPLGIINGFSELVELEQDEKKRNEYIDIIQSETRRINDLVKAMLDLSKMESENITLDMSEFDLIDVVNENLDAMYYLFKKENITLTTHLTNAFIYADEFKIDMVVSNFISNALRYTESGKEVIVTLEEHLFSVENEGAFLNEEEIEKIWLTFHKVDKSRNKEGTGLGLAICQSVLDLHKFNYGVKNTEKGVLFYFEF